jgi:mitochondrial enoyl-[acyl-carrier protein] reductase / trans-2-enoyl-CoA reductase
MSIRQIQLHQFGPPAESARLEVAELNAPEADQVQLSMFCSPINPADLNVLEGTYGTLPKLPSVIGNEGVGKIIALGKNVSDWAVGDLVIPLTGSGLWSEKLNLSPAQLVKLPAGLNPAQACQLRVNPATSARLLMELPSLQPGDWIVQNAANSAVGLGVIQLARRRGLQVLNFVRRAGAVEACRNVGAEHLIVEDAPDAKSAVASILGGQKPRLAFNAVGGESALRLAALLADEGKHVTYGAMSRQKLSIPNRFLIFQNLQFTGFWLSRWMQRAALTEIQSLYAELAELMLAGELQLPVAATYPPEQISEAIQHAQQSQRAGKILLAWNELY